MYDYEVIDACTYIICILYIKCRINKDMLLAPIYKE